MASIANPYQALPSAFENTEKGQEQQVSRTDFLTAKTTGIADPEHVQIGAVDSHLVRPRPEYQTAPLHMDTFHDVDPVSPATIDFNKAYKFNFGFEGPAMITGIELHVKLPAAPSGYRWAPWIGERLLGDSYTLKHQSEVVEEVNVDAMHVERRLLADVGSSADSAYQHAVGADPTSAAQHVWVPLRMPYNAKKPLVALAMGQEHELTFTMPALAYLLQRVSPNADGVTSAATAVTSVTATLAEVFLRVKYTDVDQKSRAFFANQALAEGFKYHVSMLEAKENVAGTQLSWTASETADKEATITGIESLIHPSAYLIVCARDSREFEVASNAELDQTDGAFTQAEALEVLETYNFYPDRYRFVPLIYWELLENNKRFLPRQSFEYDGMCEIPKLFNCEPAQPFGVIPFSKHPTLADDHSLGHLTLPNLNQPKIKIKARKIAYDKSSDPSAFFEQFSRVDPLAMAQISTTIFGYAKSGGGGSGQPMENGVLTTTLRVDIYSVYYNFVNKRGGRVWRSYV